jgi:sulfofructose kinase
MRNAQIVGLDTPWFDEVIHLEEVPPENRNGRILSATCQGGGKVSTALAAAGRLGAPAAIIAVMGTGARSDFLIEDFIAHGVDIAHIRRALGYRDGFSVVLSDKKSGGRRILWRPVSDENRLCVEDVERARAAIKGARFLHLCHLGEPDLYAARIAHAAGVQVCFDADTYREEFMPHLDTVDILIGSEEFYLSYFADTDAKAYERNIRALYGRGFSTVIFTFGAEGCKGISPEGYFELPAFRVEVVDTVGAGDVFHGAYLAGLCKGMSAEEAARYASGASAVKCMAEGGRAGIPDDAMLREFLSTGRIDEKILREREAYYREKYLTL